VEVVNETAFYDQINTKVEVKTKNHREQEIKGSIKGEKEKIKF
jgi:hypothetical protein